jgi:uncharacterized repeat protein (TIGR03833 family)
METKRSQWSPTSQTQDIFDRDTGSFDRQIQLAFFIAHHGALTAALIAGRDPLDRGPMRLLAVLMLVVCAMLPPATPFAAQQSWLLAAHPPRHAAVLAARGGPPKRRITRDAENRPVRGSGRGRGRGAGRGRRPAAPSPTAKPVVGQLVSVLQKQHYHTGERTNGTVTAVLTRAAEHSRGYKVRLSSNIVGRCIELLGDAPQPGERESGRGAIEWPDPPLPPY